MQQMRSYNLNLVQKESIWDLKSLFKNKVRQIIDEENMRTKTFD